jgi:hypothetical protein
MGHKMRKLALPPYNTVEVMDLCIDSIREDPTRKKERLQQAKSLIRHEELRYLELAPNSKLFELTESADVGGLLSQEEMEKVYTGTFSRKSSKLRSIYDRIKLAPKNGLCPLCGQRIVSQLDHYLPKKGFPAFSITPANLVPSCSDCNKTKLTIVANTAQKQILHPYFDDLGDCIWLKAEVIVTKPPAIIYKAHPPAHFTERKIDLSLQYLAISTTIHIKCRDRAYKY